jgi:hypothetical protein
MRSCPQQENVVDCGVFVMTFAACLSMGNPMTFAQANMPALRHKYTYEVLLGRFLADDDVQRIESKSWVNLLRLYLSLATFVSFVVARQLPLPASNIFSFSVCSSPKLRC